jgi:serine/threonine-protein kinase
MAHSSPTIEEPAGFAYAAGDVIASKYELEEVLGAGGMGAVFRARNTVIDMPVAIKLIRGDLNREVLSGRLLQEARAAAKLAHPAIVRVFDVGQTALGDPFIVMELLQGESLASVIDREGRLPAVRSVQLLLPIADALTAAHAKGFVHRDVKPDNVFVAVGDDQLQPKLVDFGIVKLEQRDHGRQLTQVGTLLGSPDYMSPEQARGLEDIDLRSDVWSFSVMLYESISGKAPFSSENYNALLRMIVEDEPASLCELRAADAELSAIVARGMSKSRSARFQSMSELGRALAQWLLAQGFSEDACGVSLEAKWLSRTTDPAGRISRSAPPDSWPEPPSGVRAVRRELATAETVLEAPSSQASRAGTPVSISSVGTPPSRRRQLLAGFAALLSGSSVAWWLSSSEPASRAGELTEPAAVRGDVAAARGEAASATPALGVAPTPIPAPSAVPAASAAPPPPVASSPPVVKGGAKPNDAERPLTRSSPQAEPPKAAPPAPASDLLAPY